MDRVRTSISVASTTSPRRCNSPPHQSRDQTIRQSPAFPSIERAPQRPVIAGWDRLPRLSAATSCRKHPKPKRGTQSEVPDDSRLGFAWNAVSNLMFLFMFAPVFVAAFLERRNGVSCCGAATCRGVQVVDWSFRIGQPMRLAAIRRPRPPTETQRPKIPSFPRRREARRSRRSRPMARCLGSRSWRMSEA